MEPIDRKFKILAANPCKKGSIYTEQDGFFFCAKDQFAVPAIDAYIAAMEDNGKVGEAQIKSALLLRDRVIAYQRINGFKIPDIAEGCEAELCLKPNQE